jgi:lipopolysaccharide/colanic/teichoic acid biosynthesis glycosyltransferase
MNNSELSVMTSSKDAFVAPGPCVYTQYWNNCPNERLHDEGPFQYGGCYGGVIDVERVEATSARDIRDTEAVETCPWSKVVQPNLGLWLLHSSANRHNQWEHLRRIPRDNVIARHCGLQYSSSLLKRSCDVIGSLFFLVMLFPIFILVAILIKLDSPGPVFFRHRRIGKDGDPFVLWKFRSMRTDVPEHEVSPRSVLDDRLTRIGRLIRRLSVDEMPQLINVIKGEMSLVGPRPEMPFIVASYRPADCERFFARPGITGLWQISPARAFPIHENLQYDLHYIHNQNFFLDCAIILRTVTAVIHGIGAI